MDKETRVSLRHDLDNGMSKEDILKKYKMNKRVEKYYFTELNKGKILKTNTLIHKTYPNGMNSKDVDVTEFNRSGMALSGLPEHSPYATDCAGGVITTISPLPSAQIITQIKDLEKKLIQTLLKESGYKSILE